MMRKFLFAPVLVLIFIGHALAADQEYSVDDHTMALWHFNEGSGESVTDATGNSEDGKLDPGTVWVDGKFGGGLESRVNISL